MLFIHKPIMANAKAAWSFRKIRFGPRLLTSRSKLLGSVLVMLLGMFVGSAQANSGGELAWKYHCTTCHGLTGVANSNRYPNLAGQNAPYLETRLKYFRAQEEPGNQMNAQAAPLSDEEIEQLAKYFSGRGR